MHDLDLTFEQRISAAWPPGRWSDLTVLVAVSGGADSVALLRGLHAVRSSGPGRMVAAHFNHGLRGGDSDADEQFVCELCQSLTIECRTGRPASRLQSAGEGLEAAARTARYEFLTTTAEQLGARYVATAHTADDQAETILHHVLRGTGLAGVAGMRPARALNPAVTLVRPMLETRRTEVLAYLMALDQPFREDASNAELQFTRNRIRRELLPLLARDYSPAVIESLLRLGKLAADARDVIDRLSERILDRSVTECNADRVVLDCRQMVGEHRHLVRDVLVAVWRRQAWPLRSMGFAEWDLLADMALAPVHLDVADAAAQAQTLPGAISVRRLRNELVLARACERAARS
jgi:tRNA(Ile)-lysidine synthase